jgi:hypothetical protein
MSTLLTFYVTLLLVLVALPLLSYLDWRGGHHGNIASIRPLVYR